MVLKGFPNVITQGQQDNFGEKPTGVILYTILYCRDTKTKIKEHYYQVAGV